MKNNLSRNQSGIAHLMLLVLFVAISASVVFVGLRVSGRSSNSNNLSSAAKEASTKLANSASSKIASSASSLTTTSDVAPTTSNPTSVPVKKTVTAPVAPTVTVTPAPVPAPVPVIPQGYTKIGTISAADMYYDSTPPASNLQPTMAVYACYKSSDARNGLVKAFGLLAYGIPQDASSHYMFGLTFSVYQNTLDVVTNKVFVYDYFNSSWLNNGTTAGNVNQTNIITTDGISPGVVGDYFVWAWGDYSAHNNGGSHYVSNHPNATQLAACI